MDDEIFGTVYETHTHRSSDQATWSNVCFVLNRLSLKLYTIDCMVFSDHQSIKLIDCPIGDCSSCID